MLCKNCSIDTLTMSYNYALTLTSCDVNIGMVLCVKQFI